MNSNGRVYLPPIENMLYNKSISFLVQDNKDLNNLTTNNNNNNQAFSSKERDNNNRSADQHDGYTNSTCSNKKRSRIDTNNRYKCNHCLKSFSRPSSLRIHILSHTGEKPHICPEPGCGRRFSVQSNMRRHLKVHYCNDRPEPFQFIGETIN